MITSDQELKASLERIRDLQNQVAYLRQVETNPANYHLSASGFLAEIDRMQLEVREYLSQHFITVKLNAEYSTPARYDGKVYTSRTLAERFRVNGYPTTIFLRADGNHIANVPGYVPANRFILLLRYIGDGHMDRGVSYDDFVKQQTGSNN